MSKIILITDLVDLRKRKQEELLFYHHQLVDLKFKMSLVTHEINLTTQIIDMIENEKLLDLKKLNKDN